MQKRKYTETEIMNILKEHAGGITLRSLSHQYGVNRSTISEWKQKYSGMQASDIKRLKELEAEHNRLKRMYAELSMEHAAIKDLLAKKF